MAFPSVYPTSLDSYTAKTDGVDDVMAVDVNELQSAIVAIETKLGTGQFHAATGDGATWGFKAGAALDVLWYRGAADTWRTPDALTVDGLITGSAGVTIPTAKFYNALTDGITGGYKAGSAGDVLLYRSAADAWRTPDSFTIDTGLNVGTGSGATAGQIVASGAAMLNGVTTDQYAQQFQSQLGDHGKIMLGLGAEENALVFVRYSAGAMAVYTLNGVNHTVTEVLDPSAAYTSTEDNDGFVNIYWDAAHAQYELNNEVGLAKDFHIWLMRQS
jgi:hypothetical protein